MTKHSRHEREGREAESERMVEIQRAWEASIPAPVATAFARDVAAAQTRVYVKPPDTAPGPRAEAAQGRGPAPPITPARCAKPATRPRSTASTAPGSSPRSPSSAP